MKKVFSLIQNYLLFAFPFMLISMVWSSFFPNPNNSILATGAQWLWEVFSWNLMLWFTLLFVYFLFLLFAPFARDQALRKIANLKERDERESAIAGHAAKRAYISTLALLLFLLFASIFQVSVKQLPQDQLINGKTKTLNISLGFSLLDPIPVQADASDMRLFGTTGIPLSKTAILLLIVLCQLGAYNFYFRKELEA